MQDLAPYVTLNEYDSALKRRLDKMYERYIFKFCVENDLEKFKEFIKTYWRADHIYVISPELIRWQQYDVAKRLYNFVYAENKESGEIHSCLGFIFTSQFDPAISIRDVWLGLWRSRPDAAPGLGGELARFLIKNIRPRSIGCLGLSRNTMTSIPRLGFTTGLMDHHYLLNPDITNFQLVGQAAPVSLDQSAIVTTFLFELSPEQVKDFVIEDFDPAAFCPIKTTTYVYNRFARNPFFKYRMFAVTQEGHSLGILVTRTVSALDAKAIRIVDYIGHDKGWIGLGPALIKLIRDDHAEFIDLYSHGIGKDEIAASSMIRHREEDRVIIPLYFEPFEKRNKGLDYGYVVPDGTHYRVFKADSDQDRTNRMVNVRL